MRTIEEGNYHQAIPNYLNVARNSNNDDAMIKLADCYRMTGQNNSALMWYQKVVQIKNVQPVYQFYYAEALMKNGRYDEAKFYLNKYLAATQGDERANVMLQSCDSIDQFFRDTLMYDITRLTIDNTNSSKFSPAFYKSGIVFVSERQAGLIGNDRKDYDLYYSKITEFGNWLEPEVLRGDVNGIFNEGPAIFNSTYTKMFFTRNNYSGNDIVKNNKNESVLKIYEGRLEGVEWKILDPLPFCSDIYSVAHPALSYDGKTMYFVSDMAWGYGGTDIYKVEYQNGKWSNPQNLGPNINTTSNELFPYLQNDSVLYFSSDGLPGLGGLDVYRSVSSDDSWAKPRNLGFPVNTSMDDFSFIIDQQGKVGYFSSNRESGVDKLYSFKKNPPVLSVKGLISDKESGSPLRNMVVNLESEGQLINSTTTGTDGIYRFKLEPGKKYRIYAGNNSFYHCAHSFSTNGLTESTVLRSKLEMEQIVLYSTNILEDLRFDGKNYEVTNKVRRSLDKLAQRLIDNPNLVIELYSYTDSRGSDVENMALTTSRALKIEEYLADRGIDSSRFSVLPKGESNLLNHCVNGILCLDEEHAVNNRIEVKVLGFVN